MCLQYLSKKRNKQCQTRNIVISSFICCSRLIYICNYICDTFSVCVASIIPVEFYLLVCVFLIEERLRDQVSYFEIYMDKIRDLLDGKLTQFSYTVLICMLYYTLAITYIS